MQKDFVMAFTQAAVEYRLFIIIQEGFEVEGDEEYVLKHKNNLIHQTQAGRVWNKHLIKRLKKVGFVASQTDECLLYMGQRIFVLYTDDSGRTTFHGIWQHHWGDEEC